MAAKEDVHVVTIHSFFDTPEKMVERLKIEIGKYKLPNTIFLFPESVLGDNPISALDARKLAVAVNVELKQHPGNPLVAYSVYQQGTQEHEIRHDGYLVGKTTMGGKDPFIRYHKVTTFKGGGVTHGELQVFKRFSKDPNRSRIIFRQNARRVTHFPQVEMGGHLVRLQVCSDALRENDAETHPAYSNTTKADLILVPAHDIRPKKNVNAPYPNAVHLVTPGAVDHLKNQLVNNGIAVVADGIYQQRVIVHNDHGTIKAYRTNDAQHIQGRFNIHRRS
jgi:hypothetical protein